MNLNKRQQQIENAANAAQARGNGAQGESALSSRIRAMMQGSRQPPRNNSEAWGRALQTFVLPLIAQGVDSWKSRYDARGDFNANVDRLLGAIARGEQLTPSQQGIVDTYEKYYPDKYAAKLQEYRLANPTQDATPSPDFGSLPQVGTPFQGMSEEDIKRLVQGQLLG